MTQDFINLLSKEQKIRLAFYQEFKNDAEKAYNFVMQPTINENQTNNSEFGVNSKNDGIYLIDVNGNAVKFVGDKTEMIQGIAYIGIVEGYKRLKVAVNEFKTPLQDEKFDCDSIKDYEGYVKYRNDALMDWNGNENTKHILIQNPQLTFILKEGEYIPSLGQLVFIWEHRNEINKALEFIGCNPLSQSYTWSSTERYNTDNWYLHFSDGYINDMPKLNGFVLRPVADF